MKYIKESNNLPTIDELTEQTDIYLAYLYDEGFEFLTDEESNQIINRKSLDKELYSIKIFKPSFSKNESSFEWSDIDNYLIPYLGILDEYFDFSVSFYNYHQKNSSILTKEQIFNNELDGLMTNIQLVTIRLYPKKLYPKEKLNRIQKFGNFIKKKFK